MAISDKLRRFITNENVQKILEKNDLELLLDWAFTILEFPEYKEFIELLMLKYENLFSELVKIDAGMFKEISGLGDISLQPTITTIPSQCFQKSDITSIEGENVTIVANAAFGDCHKLVNINLPSLEQISVSGFINCTALKRIDLPKTLTRIGGKSFAGCTNLKEIYYHGTKEEFSKVGFGMAWDGTYNSSGGIKIICLDGEYGV